MEKGIRRRTRDGWEECVQRRRLPCGRTTVYSGAPPSAVCLDRLAVQLSHEDYPDPFLKGGAILNAPVAPLRSQKGETRP